jgi:Arc/MetJ-type ribon-helix-helix transcriptional regulator
MQLTLEPHLEQFIEQQARQRGYATVSDYVRDVLEGERLRQAGAQSNLEEQLRLAAVERFDEDRLIAEEWFAVEQEAHEQDH